MAWRLWLWGGVLTCLSGGAALARAQDLLPVDPAAAGRHAALRPMAAAPSRVIPRLDARGDAAPRPQLLRGSAGERLTPPSDEPAEIVARAFVAARIGPPGDLVHAGTVTGGGGVRFVTFEQGFGGRPVALGRLTVAVAADGSVLAAHWGELAPAPPAPAVGGAVPGLDEDGARGAALVALGRRADAATTPDLRAEPVYLATATGCVGAWRVRLGLAEQPEQRYEVVLGDGDGRLLRRDRRTFPAVDAAHVVPLDPTRSRAWVSFPDPIVRPSVDSPTGWCYDQETTGNNVWAQLDREADFLGTAGATAAATGSPPVFDFAYTGVPADDADLALANVFWALNDAHDRFRALGLDEASGAMQDENFGRGGRGGDRIWALVQYASYDGTTPYGGIGLGTSSDGSFTYMVVGLFDDSGELRDGALETDLLYHEYAHGVSIRLVGDDAACLGGSQPEALSEGWSDFLAASFTGDPVIGAWTSGNSVSGHRRRSLDASTFTYFNFCADGCNRFFDGEIWSGALWDLRRALVQRDGQEQGASLAERLVVEGMRYTPCRPTFPQARDGLVLADLALSGGRNRCVIWQAMAGRGIGYSATTAGPDDDAPLPAFDRPPECLGGAAVAFDQVEYATDAEGEVIVVDATPAPGASLTVTTSRGDAVTVSLRAAPGAPALRAGFEVRPGPVVATDGVLQVAATDTLTASYDPGGAVVTAQARVSAALPFSVRRHFVWGDCDDPAGTGQSDDHPDGWYVVPGFLDAGEVANVVVTLGHEVPVPLEDVRVTVACGNPRVRVLPTTPLVVGDVPARTQSMPREIEIEVRAEASPAVTPGETAVLVFDVEARGRRSSTALDLLLDQDYVVQQGLSPFAGGVETFDPPSPTRSSWSHQAYRGAEDLWALQDCAGRGGSAGYANSELGCGGYVDGQVASALVSPPLMSVPPDTAAWRLADFGWDNLVNLWTDPANPYCDADIVAAYATVDPGGLPYDEPLNVYSTGPQRVWLFPDNTGSYVTGGPYYVNREPQFVIPGAPYDQLRLAFVFWGDAVDCGFETTNTGLFAVDQVRWRYDLLRVVPESNACAADCVLRTQLEALPPGPKCPGEPFTLSATVTEVSGCTGPIRYSFGGAGIPPGYDWTYENQSPAVGADDQVYAVYAQCESDGGCADYRQLVNVSPARPGLGGPWPDSLRVARAGDDVLIAWLGGAVPPAYGVYRATTRAELEAPHAAWPMAVAVDEEGPRGEGAARVVGEARTPGLAFYHVFGRDACTDAPRVP
jgi:extracellular elastinolytic metalloproteinase